MTHFIQLFENVTKCFLKVFFSLVIQVRTFPVNCFGFAINRSNDRKKYVIWYFKTNVVIKDWENKYGLTRNTD
jgi:hypothetical protein